MFENKLVFKWYMSLLFFEISHSAHSDKMLLLWNVLLDHLMLNCMELLTLLQGGLKIVLLSWRTFPSTDFHSQEHLWGRCQSQVGLRSASNLIEPIVKCMDRICTGLQPRKEKEGFFLTFFRKNFIVILEKCF